MKICIYCGKPWKDHVERRPENELVPRVRCGLYKSMFKADPESGVITKPYNDE